MYENISPFKLLVTCKHSFDGTSISQVVIDFPTKESADLAYSKIADVNLQSIDRRHVEKLY